METHPIGGDPDHRAAGSPVWQALRLFAVLIKWPISLLAMLTTAAGYLLFAQRLSLAMWVPLLGTFLVAAGALALNHVQDASVDARMKRTAGRPIPSGRVDRGTVVFASLILTGIGLGTLAQSPVDPLGLLGLAAGLPVWYNGLYAWLKRVTAFAAVPGAAVGALPPAIGWVSAGGRLDDERIWLLAAFYFLWQVPHFWLILLRHGDDYSQAGLPSLRERVGEPGLARITFSWIAATAAYGPLAAAFIGLPDLAVVGSAVGSFWLVFSSLPLLRVTAGRLDYARQFRRTNLYALVFTLLVIARGLRLPSGH